MYGYTPENEKEIVNVNVYPNPANGVVISYTNFLVSKAIFTLYDIAGRLVKTKNYNTQNKGR